MMHQNTEPTNPTPEQGDIRRLFYDAWRTMSPEDYVEYCVPDDWVFANEYPESVGAHGRTFQIEFRGEICTVSLVMWPEGGIGDLSHASQKRHSKDGPKEMFTIVVDTHEGRMVGQEYVEAKEKFDRWHELINVREFGIREDGSIRVCDDVYFDWQDGQNYDGRKIEREKTPEHELFVVELLKKISEGSIQHPGNPDQLEMFGPLSDAWDGAPAWDGGPWYASRKS